MTRAALFCLLALSCAHGPSAAAHAVKPTGLKHVVMPLSAPEDVPRLAALALFEQSFCSAIYEMNGHFAICAEDVATYLKFQRERHALGADAAPPEEAQRVLDAPRKVLPSAAPAPGGGFAIVVLVQDRGGTALGRFEASLRADGSNVVEQARLLAAQVLSIGG